MDERGLISKNTLGMPAKEEKGEAALAVHFTVRRSTDYPTELSKPASQPYDCSIRVFNIDACFIGVY